MRLLLEPISKMISSANNRRTYQRISAFIRIEAEERRLKRRYDAENETFEKGSNKKWPLLQRPLKSAPPR